MRQKKEEPSSIGKKAKGPEWFYSLRSSMRYKKENKHTPIKDSLRFSQANPLFQK